MTHDSSGISALRPRPEESVFLLPGGYVDEAGVAHREVELCPMTGHEEEYLASLPGNTSSAAAITQLLLRCVRRIGNRTAMDASAIRGLLVGDREFLMLRLRQITSGNKLHMMLECPFPECGRKMEMPLLLNELPLEERPVRTGTFTVDLEDGGTVEFRLPTGADQEAFAHRASDPASVSELLAGCILRTSASVKFEDVAPRVEARMEQLAPQLDLEVDAACPHCGQSFSTPLDLAGFVLSEAAAEVHHLRRDVHVLAWHYHWSENEILAMSRKKRRRYIELLEHELERMESA